MEAQKALKVDKTVKTFADANEKMGRGELDATIELPANFGVVEKGQTYPIFPEYIRTPVNPSDTVM